MQRFLKLDGVEKTTFDYMTAEVTAFVKEGGPTPEQLLQECLDADLQCVLGGGKGSYLKPPGFKQGSDVSWLTHTGQEVDLEASLVPGKVTVIDFYAEWCGPCRMVDEAMVQTLPEQPDIAFRKINIVDWDSPVAKQHLKGVSNLPHVLVYSKKGERVGAMTSLDLPKLMKLIEQGRTQ
jgi:thiol-disulfide isomerase/thioredoxin